MALCAPSATSASTSVRSRRRRCRARFSRSDRSVASVVCPRKNARPRRARTSSVLPRSARSRTVSSNLVRHGQCSSSTRWSAYRLRWTRIPRPGRTWIAASTTSSTVVGAVRTSPCANPAVPKAQAAPEPTLSNADVACHHHPSRPGTVRYTPWRTRVHRPVSSRWRTARYVMPAARHCCRVTSPRCWSTTSLSVARSVGVGGPPSTGPNAARSVTVPGS